MPVALSQVGIELGKVVLAIVVLVAGSWLLLLLLGLGPLGWLVLVVLALVIGYTLSSWYGEDEDATARPDRVNCPNCGARIDADSDRCDYCDESLSPSE